MDIHREELLVNLSGAINHSTFSFRGCDGSWICIAVIIIKLMGKLVRAEKDGHAVALGLAPSRLPIPTNKSPIALSMSTPQLPIPTVFSVQQSADLVFKFKLN